ncbi:hypothetical protein Tco_0785467 [Tanacetum coccineum]
MAKEAVTKIDNNKDCKAIFTNDGAPLYTPFYYSLEEIEYFLANFGFSDDDELNNVTSIPEEDLKQTSPKQTTTHYVEPYIPPIPFPKRLEQHAEEALIHKTMESLKKIKSNRPFLKEIRQSDEYPKFMKDLVANKPLTMQNEDIRINYRCSALLLNQLPLKEKDPRSFILPCSIGSVYVDYRQWRLVRVRNFRWREVKLNDVRIKNQRYADVGGERKLRGNSRDRLDSYSFGNLAEFAAVRA